MLGNNQHLNTQQTVKAFKDLGFTEDKVMATIDIEGFNGLEITNSLALLIAIKKALASEVNPKIVLLRVNCATRNFTEVEGENNHYVGLLINKNNDEIDLTYVDPTGKAIAEEVKQLIKSNIEQLKDIEIKSAQIALQYTNESSSSSIYAMGGNDYDCGVLLPMCIKMLHEKGNVLVDLNEDKSKQLGHLLRKVVRSEVTFVNVEGEVNKLLIREREEEKGPEPKLGQKELSIEECCKNLEFLFKLPKAFKDLKAEDKDKLKELNDGCDIKIKNFSKIVAEIKDNVLIQIKNFDKINPYNLVTVLNQTNFNDSSIKSAIMQASVNHLTNFNKLLNAEVRIKQMAENLKLIDPENIKVSINPTQSANETYIVEDLSEHKKYYTKTFSNDSHVLGPTYGKIHPNELLVYKIMEYIGFGPKTHFLMSLGSSSAGSESIYKGNYIMTEDVEVDGAELLFDKEENSEEFIKIAGDRKFAVEVSAASAVNDLLSLWDTFGVNTGNYGIVFSQDYQDYNLQFVDHLPNANNGILSRIRNDEKEISEYSPRQSLMKNPKKTTIAKLATTVSKDNYMKAAIQEDVVKRLFEPTEFLSFSDAVVRARNDVLILMEEYRINFIKDANVEFNTYIAKIESNIKTYQSTVEATRGMAR